MSKDKDKIRATIGTIIVHLLVLLALIFLGLSTPLPLPGEEGVEVNLGYTDQGMGLRPETQQPSTSPPQPQPSERKEEVIEDLPPQQAEEQPVLEDIQEEEILTQRTEDAPSLVNPEEKEDVKDVPDEEIIDKKTEQKDQPKEEDTSIPENNAEEQPEQVEPEPEPEPQVNPRALYKGPTKSEGQGQNEGQTGEAGNQGSEQGDPASENYEGRGGSGSGISYDLGGRGHKHLPKPAYTSEDQGRVVVTIWVDRTGRVTKANAGAKGTTVSDMQLRNLAKEAAMRAKFNPDPNAPEVQKGTITYNFIKLK